MKLNRIVTRLAPRKYQAGSGISGAWLILASAAALFWSNSAAAPLYRQFRDWPLGPGRFAQPAHVWVNEGLMALFFLLVGLEIRREMTTGRLSSLRGVAAPGIAAMGGMLVPAAIYLSLNHGNPHTLRGWAVPMTTDIAFSLAVLRLLGKRAHGSVRLFLTAVAILDDLAAIVVIGLFYAHDVQTPELLMACIVWLLLFGLNRLGVRHIWLYLLGGAAIWVLLFSSGVEATLAGVALACVMPAREHTGNPSPAATLERRLEPLVYYLVLPVFGLVNAGLDIGTLKTTALLAPAPLGVFLGLCVGKQAGVLCSTLLGRRLNLLTLPPGMALRDLYGVALLCGIGFTMSLFISALAFQETGLQDGIKLAVLSASLVSALCGLIFLACNPHRATPV